jgi:hypothetical protein
MRAKRRRAQQTRIVAAFDDSHIAPLVIEVAFSRVAHLRDQPVNVSASGVLKVKSLYQ